LFEDADFPLKSAWLGCPLSGNPLALQPLNGNIIHAVSRCIDGVMSAIANARHD